MAHTFSQKEKLTWQEQRIFDLLLTGAIPKDIAAELHISYNTVLTHQRKIYQKLGVHSIEELLVTYLKKKEQSVISDTNPLVITFKENRPYPWLFDIYSGMYFYKNEWQPSPFKLGTGKKINEGDAFYVTFHFTPNVDLDELFVLLQDFTVPINHDLSNYCSFGWNFKADTEYKVGEKLTATRSASSTEPRANILAIYAKANIQPTISFTKMEIEKAN